MNNAQSFGGDWTRDKLERVRKYLDAYVTVLKNQPFELIYVDAFAGSGYVREKDAGEAEESGLFALPELAEEESQGFIIGSARMALEVDPAFDKYIFIEKKGKHVNKLHELTGDYPALASRIEVIQDDANEYLQKLCSSVSWIGQRAVLFLDPFGMQVSWSTIEAIANTKAIDLWYLFPSIMRMLPRQGRMVDAWQSRLDSLFGTHEWYDAFFQENKKQTLFGAEEDFIAKTVDFDAVARFLVDRLNSIFPGVVQQPLILRSSKKNVPLFLLCFAAGNEKGAPIAVKIAKHILGKR